MTSEPAESRLIRQVYARALRLDPEDRDEYLESACAGQPDLRTKVDALLDAARDSVHVGRPLRSASINAETHAGSIEGRRIGHYVIRREIGRGGMGVVYLADDTRLSRSVALKALSPALGRAPGSRERLRLEARAAAGLSHPGIATVYALESIDDDLYLACEYVPGEPLRALLASGPLPFDEIIRIAVQLSRALAAAHTRGIVHRDIKPENVIRTPSGVVKVLDFGLARMDGAYDAALTADGVILGTPAYLAPEQALGHEVDFRTDLFALGLVIYEMAAGINPFAAKTVTTTISRIISEDPTPLSELRPDILPELDRIITTCLRKDPHERYGSTQALVEALETVGAALSGARMAALPVGARSSPQLPHVQTWHPRWWWDVHQLVVSMVYVLMMYPAWTIRAWLPPPFGMLFLLGILASAAVAASLRLHLWFLGRFSPHELAHQLAWTRLLTRACDATIALLQIGAAVAIGAVHPEFAMLLVVVSTVTLVASFVIEPATARAAFAGAAVPASSGSSRA